MEPIEQDEIELAEALLAISNENAGGQPPATSVLNPVKAPFKPKEPSKSVSDEINDILKNHHGDNYYLDRNMLSILYPEITLTNSDGITHVIKNLIVKLKVTNRNNEFKLTEHAMYGKRMTKNVAEWHRGYEHSHLPGKSSCSTNTGYQTFCLGYSQIKITLDRLMRYDKNTCLEQFELLLHQIDEYVSWESLEGGPHDLMSNIVLNESSNTRINSSQSRQAVYILFEKISELPIDIVKHGSQLKLNPSLELLEAMHKIYSEYPSVILDGKIQNSDQSGSKYGSVSAQQAILSRNRIPDAHVTFGNKRIPFTVEVVEDNRQSEILTINQAVYRVFYKTFNYIINNPTFKITPTNVKKEIEVSQG